MLRFKILASVVPLLAAAVFARGEIGSVSHPCIALGETSVELTSLFWTAGVHIAFTDDLSRATVRVQITDGPADYRIYVRSKTFSQREAAALIVGANGGHRPLPLQAASL
ncbi:hypothetical protein IVB34_43940 [Bradyrhizobium sp. 2]|uniref:hypothetical protein n=1 Tax=Bradyrhizobium sp. 2 TaxID=190045 RepID=UPI001FF9A630|nr:hypothetical protein [Bradyrhizobium sp. 2]MCK1465128.1 hypothetical protein [Bradyrhizobium sp. 2]